MKYQIDYGPNTLQVECKSPSHAARVSAALIDAGPYRIDREGNQGSIANAKGVLATFKAVSN